MAPAPAPRPFLGCAPALGSLLAIALCVACSSAPPPKAKSPPKEDPWSDFDPASSLEDPTQQSSLSKESASAVDDSQGYSRAPPALLGARHDLQLNDGAQTSCKCLQVAYGSADRKEFVWAGTTPTLESDQWAVAFRAAACGNSDALLSYRGFERRGTDIVVRVESAHAGRPRVMGAVVPKPIGRLIIQPHALATDHGRSLKDGERSCVVAEADPGATNNVSTARVAAAKPREPAGVQSSGRDRMPNFDDQPPPTHLTK